MSEPQIILGQTEGIHNLDMDESRERLLRGRGYEDLSTICVRPTRGMVDIRVVESWEALQTPMNQLFTRMSIKGMEVADAYNVAIETILAHPQLRDWKYVLTLEEDNLPPADGLKLLHERLSADSEFSAVGGLYWTKGEGGQPMIYGKPGQVPMFAPQMPEPQSLVECNGLGMGFTLFRMDLFRDDKIERPWFKTVQENGQAYSQDLWFFQKAREAGHRIACDTRVLVGHYDSREDKIW